MNGEAYTQTVEAMFEEQFTYCEACNGIGQDENACFWCSPCKGQGYVLDPEQNAAFHEDCIINARAALDAFLSDRSRVVALLIEQGVLEQVGMACLMERHDNVREWLLGVDGTHPRRARVCSCGPYNRGAEPMSEEEWDAYWAALTEEERDEERRMMDAYPN